jgi:hypothetical protein
MCEAGICVTAPAECQAVLSCGLGRNCAVGTSIPAVPCIGGACPAGTECAFGVACVPRVACDATAECPAPTVCLNGACDQQPPACVASSECGEGFVCRDGACRQRALCALDADCPDELVCDFGECASPTPCFQDAQCAAGRECSGGLCLPIIQSASCDAATRVDAPVLLFQSFALGAAELTASCGESSGTERVYVVPAGAGPLCASLSGAASASTLSVRNDCPGRLTSELACGSAQPNRTARVDVGLSGEDQFVIADHAAGPGDANFTLEFSPGPCPAAGGCVTYEDCDRGSLCIGGACVLNAGGLCTEGEVRLLGGPNTATGRVEVCHHGVWGTICSDGFDALDATVVCGQLGFDGDAAFELTGAYGDGPADLPTWITGLGCALGDASLTDCAPVYNQGTCLGGHAAALECSGELAAVEVCNGLDDDGNGLADDNTVEAGQPCLSPLPGRCAIGSSFCSNGRLSCTPGRPASEVCNCVDDNCNGQTDELQDCPPCP